MFQSRCGEGSTAAFCCAYLNGFKCEIPCDDVLRTTKDSTDKYMSIYNIIPK